MRWQSEALRQCSLIISTTSMFELLAAVVTMGSAPIDGPKLAAVVGVPPPTPPNHCDPGLPSKHALSAPAVSNARTMSTWPSWAAHIKAVTPQRGGACTAALPATRWLRKLRREKLSPSRGWQRFPWRQLGPGPSLFATSCQNGAVFAQAVQLCRP